MSISPTSSVGTDVTAPIQPLNPSNRSNRQRREPMWSQHQAAVSAHRRCPARKSVCLETEAVRTDRLGLLLSQFDQAREMAQVRLTGLGDEEYLWEPVPGCWSIRRRGEAATPRGFGHTSAPSPTRRRRDHRVAAGASALPLREGMGVDLRGTPRLLAVPIRLRSRRPMHCRAVGGQPRFIHHMAEIAVLRGLWQARFAPPG